MRAASKKAKGEILDRLVAEVGWSRANARRQLGKAFKRRGLGRALLRRPRPPTYGYDTVKVLQQVWVVAGQPCGKYLAAVMGPTLANMDARTMTGAFGKVHTRYSPEVRAQLLAMSAATIDRLLAPIKLSMYPDGKSTTRIAVATSKDPTPQARMPNATDRSVVAHAPSLAPPEGEADTTPVGVGPPPWP
ncbi:hypothetical protein [Arthrobacter alpinus]|uniref:hypothetical protein n=1 Tax=Arthrobacter alpinus TaxID=656366 RepID=UPI0007843566|nr:hypothetical protein [Arthrobacter alpinus]